VARAPAADLKGGDKEANSAIARGILEGKRGPRRDIVLVNASAALVAAGEAANFIEGVTLAADSIDSGAAAAKVKHLREFE
jgi:anthranilate phosphoribosyltransferase